MVESKIVLKEVDKHFMPDTQRYSMFLKIEPELCIGTFKKLKEDKPKIDSSYLIIQSVSPIDNTIMGECWISKYEYDTLNFE